MYSSVHFGNLWFVYERVSESVRVIYGSVACHMSLKLQCPFSAEIISTKSGSYYSKRSVDVMIYYYLWSQGLVYARWVRCAG